MRKIIIAILIVLAAAIAVPSLVQLVEERQSDPERLIVKVLILPKFEVDEMYGDFPGEAQYYYEQYFMDAEEYEIEHGNNGKLFYKDGAAMYLPGMGKVNAALNTMAVLMTAGLTFQMLIFFPSAVPDRALKPQLWGMCL